MVEADEAQAKEVEMNQQALKLFELQRKAKEEVEKEYEKVMAARKVSEANEKAEIVASEAKAAIEAKENEAEKKEDINVSHPVLFGLVDVDVGFKVILTTRIG